MDALRTALRSRQARIALLERASCDDGLLAEVFEAEDRAYAALDGAQRATFWLAVTYDRHAHEMTTVQCTEVPSGD